MASTRDIRRRIKSVKNTAQITKAMQMVASSKMRKAQQAALAGRPYATLMNTVLANVSQHAGDFKHPLMEARENPRRIEVVLLTSDRGLCGGFNSNIIRRAQRFLVEEGDKYEAIQFSTIGRRGRDFARKRGIDTRKDYVGFFGRLRYAMAKQVADDLIVEFRERKLDAVYLLYNQFRSAMSQTITLTRLLPIAAPAEAAKAQEKGGFITPEHLYEPSRPKLLEHLIPRQLAMSIWRALLESEASEHGARMTAMDSATKNANDMIGRLSLEYNRARQASITKELMEIVSGAEALKS